MRVGNVMAKRLLWACIHVGVAGLIYTQCGMLGVWGYCIGIFVAVFED